MTKIHDSYGKNVLKLAFPNDFDESPKGIHFDPEKKDAGTARIDGLIGDDIAVEIESRVSKQVRGALVDLAFHPRKKKLLVLIREHNDQRTAPQSRIILKRLCEAKKDRFKVIEIDGSGKNRDYYLRSDAKKIRDAVAELRQEEPNQ